MGLDCRNTLSNTSLSPGCRQLETQGAADQVRWTWMYGWIVSLGGVVGLPLCWGCVKAIERLGISIYRNRHEYDEGDRSISGTLEVDPFMDVREDAELRATIATFQTGNVFYEVLFTTINPDKVFVNFWY